MRSIGELAVMVRLDLLAGPARDRRRCGLLLCAFLVRCLLPFDSSRYDFLDLDPGTPPQLVSPAMPLTRCAYLRAHVRRWEDEARHRVHHMEHKARKKIEAAAKKAGARPGVLKAAGLPRGAVVIRKGKMRRVRVPVPGAGGHSKKG